MSLPAHEAGTLNYNGFQFSAAMETMAFDAKPIPDQARRTVTHTEFTMTVRDHIAGQPTDAGVQLARRLLSKPAGVLAYLGSGFGDFLVNAGSVRDVAWGPWPEVVSLTHVGSKNCTEIVWTVTFSIPDCSQAVYRLAPMELNFTVSYDVDRQGLTRRTVSGFVQIPQTRQRVSSRTLSDNADKYRDLITPPLLPGFRRTPGNFQLSADKCRLDFTVIDEQFPRDLYPPPGVVDIKCNHTVSTTMKAAVRWTSTISCSYTVDRATSKNVAVKHFLDLCKDRVNDLLKAGRQGRRANAREYITVLPLGFNLNNDVYDNTVNFSFTYMIIAKGIEQLLKYARLFESPPQSDWKKWSESLKTALSNRGHAGLEFLNSDDAIVDLCRDGVDFVGEDVGKGRMVELKGGVLEFPKPLEANSWIEYQCGIRLESDSGVVEIRTLPTEPLELESRSKSRSDGANYGFPENSGRIVVESLKNAPDVGQQHRTGQMVYVFLTGHAIRAEFPIPLPKLTAVPGVTIRDASRLENGEGFVQKVASNYEFPMYAAKWNLRFSLSEIPEVGIEKLLPANPLYGVPETRNIPKPK